MSHKRRLKGVLLICLKNALKLSEDVYRCLIEDDLQISYQKMSRRCLIGDDFQMSCRYLKDVLYNQPMFYIIYV